MKDLSVKLQKAVGFRNVSVHEYDSIDWEIVWHALLDRKNIIIHNRPGISCILSENTAAFIILCDAWRDRNVQRTLLRHEYHLFIVRCKNPVNQF
ncbi:MAG: hypothetical protein DRP70_15005 [Spirochaetes bacterium]|nr:MAG: hypothetical protein DRP70_15005 [Spirochaetota bacterium]